MPSIFSEPLGLRGCRDTRLSRMATGWRCELMGNPRTEPPQLVAKVVEFLRRTIPGRGITGEVAMRFVLLQAEDSHRFALSLLAKSW